MCPSHRVTSASTVEARRLSPRALALHPPGLDRSLIATSPHSDGGGRQSFGGGSGRKRPFAEKRHISSPGRRARRIRKIDLTSARRATRRVKGTEIACSRLICEPMGFIGGEDRGKGWRGIATLEHLTGRAAATAAAAPPQQQPATTASAVARGPAGISRAGRAPAGFSQRAPSAAALEGLGWGWVCVFCFCFSAREGEGGSEPHPARRRRRRGVDLTACFDDGTWVGRKWLGDSGESGH